MIFGGSYADNSSCDWRSGLSIFILVALFYLGLAACANVGLRLGEMAGYPETGALFGIFGVPILAVLINGWRAGKHEGT